MVFFAIKLIKQQALVSKTLSLIKFWDFLKPLVLFALWWQGRDNIKTYHSIMTSAIITQFRETHRNFEQSLNVIFVHERKSFSFHFSVQKSLDYYMQNIPQLT